METHAHTATTAEGEFCVEHRHEYGAPGHDHQWAAAQSPRAVCTVIPMAPNEEFERNVVSLQPVLATRPI